jgi:alanyl-tRNA synthetase
LLNLSKNFLIPLASKVIEIYKRVYPEIKSKETDILTIIQNEEERFEKTLKMGIEELKKMFDRIRALDLITNDAINSKEFFDLFQTHGFPIEMSFEEIENMATKVNYNLEIDKEKIKADFDKEFKKHQELSRAGAEQKFKGGLADHSEQATKYHTATHLLLAALREILSLEIYQKGSNITAERLRFDFNYPQKLNEEQIKKIEDLVNEKIRENITVETIEMPKGEALKTVKISFDPAKYGDIVKVYKIDDFSIELCGGPHINMTGELGRFKIMREESSGAGIRRIRAILE